MRPDRLLSRRALLVSGVLLAAGCQAHHATAPKPADDPDAATLRSFLTGEQRLLASYDAALRHATGHRRNDLLVQRAAHSVHLKALQQVAPRTPAPVDAAGHVTSALRRSVARLHAAAATVHLGDNAALLASIAASHAAMTGAGAP